MDAFMKSLEEKLLPVADRIGRISFLTALGATFQILLPVIMIGSFACLGAFMPVDAWQQLIAGNGLGLAFMTLQSLTLSIIGLYIAFVLPYQYAQRLGLKPLGPAITAFMSFLLITPTELYTNIPSQWLGYAGMFTVLIVAWLAVRLCKLCEDKGIYIHMPESVPPMVEESFKTLVPAFIAAVVPSIFGINEPLLFGIPIILDPLLFIPYVLNPIVCTTLSYLVYATGLIPRLTGTVVNWAMPQVLSGFLAQGPQSAIWQVVLIAITTAIWYPFFKIVDRRLAAAEEAQDQEQQLA